jgi:hypothetical protein
MFGGVLHRDERITRELEGTKDEVVFGMEIRRIRNHGFDDDTASHARPESKVPETLLHRGRPTASAHTGWDLRLWRVFSRPRTM